MEKDVRHMEVFGTACIAYAQQFFIYTNRESVSRGVYGPVPSPSPGLLAHHPGSKGVSGTGRSPGQFVEGEEGFHSAGAGEDDDDVTMEDNSIQYPSHHPIRSSHSPTSFDTSKPTKPPTHRSKHHHLLPGGGITMPVRIDPEEEKRLSILRKRVAASEAKREVLETEYLSLRAHYVHESHLLRHARRNTDGQLGLLKELARRRGEVLALRRVRVAVGREILEVLKYRETGGVVGGDLLKSEDDVVATATAAVASLDSATQNNTTSTTSTKEEDISNKVPEDLIDIWTTIESRLHEAELACSEVPAPKELFLVKSSLSTAVAAARSTSTGSNASSGATSSTSSSSEKHTTTASTNHKTSSSSNNTTTTTPSGSNTASDPNEDQDNDNDGSGSVSVSGSSNNGSNSLAKKKGGGKGDNSKQDAKSSGTTSTVGEEDHNNASNTNNNNNKGSSTTKSHKRATSNNTNTATEESSPSTEGGDVIMNDGASTTVTATTTTSSKTKKKQSSSPSQHNIVNGDDKDDNVIPWSCQSMPRTPYDVSVFISNLSSVPDGSAAFGCGSMFGNNDSSMIWLESNIPKPSSPHTSAQMQSEVQKLLRLRREVRDLSEKLDGDVTKNRDLQNDLIANRKRSDELSAMISMLRTETEAVLIRHNGILETPEARASAVALLHAKSVGKAEVGDGIEEDDLSLGSNSEDDEDMDEEGEFDEKDKSSDGGTVIEDEEGEEGGHQLFGTEMSTLLKDPADSVEEGEIHEEGLRLVTNSDFEDENGEDEEDEEEFHDAVHQHQPMKEVIVPRLGSRGVEGEGESAVVDEEDGEINESYITATSFEAGKRSFSDANDIGTGEVYTTALADFPENDPDKKRRRV